MKGILFFSCLFFFITEVNAVSLDTTLSQTERQEVDARLGRFYKRDKGSMDQPIPKFGTDGSRLSPNTVLKRPKFTSKDALENQAQSKVLPAYQQMRCQRFLKKQFPEIRCDGPSEWETAKGNDLVESLTESYLGPDDVIHDLDHIPAKGKITTPFWSGDYWRMNRGLTSFRYSGDGDFKNYKEAIEAYRQPAEWLALFPAIDPAKIAEDVVTWSPAEKYDLLTGETGYTLTTQQKSEGLPHVGEDGTIESWFGACHGWAPASVFVPPPTKPVSTVGAKGVPVVWYPDDIRAMVTIAWANGKFRSNYVGGRCNAKKPKRYPNGRLSEDQCFDNNPATLHKSLGNLIGLQNTPFIMDSSFDYEVWNQPVLAYEFTYFNPLNSEAKSKNWADVTVPYDAAFKKYDRFQQPLTRGTKKTDGSFDDSKIKQMVGVIATMSYLNENSAVHGDIPEKNSVVRVTYTYDLELHQKSDRLVALGGEWHENTHPDFLWVPQKGAVALTAYDRERLDVDLKREPHARLTDMARAASNMGYPLCQVVEKLVSESSDSSGYRCPTSR